MATQFATFKLHEIDGLIQDVYFVSPGDTSVTQGQRKNQGFMPPSVIESANLKTSIEELVKSVNSGKRHISMDEFFQRVTQKALLYGIRA